MVASNVVYFQIVPMEDKCNSYTRRIDPSLFPQVNARFCVPSPRIDFFFLVMRCPHDSATCIRSRLNSFLSPLICCARRTGFTFVKLNFSAKNMPENGTTAVVTGAVVVVISSLVFAFLYRKKTGHCLFGICSKPKVFACCLQLSIYSRRSPWWMIRSNTLCR